MIFNADFLAIFKQTRSQAVARIVDRTASQHLRGPFDSPYVISCWWFFGTKPLSLTVSEIFNVKLTQWLMT